MAFSSYCWPPTTCPKSAPHLTGCSHLCQDPRVIWGPRPAQSVLWCPGGEMLCICRGFHLHREERVRAALWGTQGVLVYNIKPSLTLTFLWTKAFTLETPSVFLPIIMITEHVIPFLLFFFPSFDLSPRSCFLCSPGHSAPPSPSHLWETHAGTHGLYCKASLKARGKKTRSKSHKCGRCQVVPQDLYLTPSSGLLDEKSISRKSKAFLKLFWVLL